jgi:stress response protein YsnF
MSSDSNIDWNNVMKKEAIGIGGADLGQVHEVEDTYLIIQKGLVDKKWYRIPRSLVENFDGIVLRLKVNESELTRYEKTENKKMEDNPLSSPSSSYESTDISKDIDTTKIPLMGEDLKITKNIAEDNINITKVPIRETKTLEIQLTHEEILIERRPVNSDYNSYVTSIQSTEQKSSSSSSIEGPVESRTEISIPLKREEPVVTKKPYVIEEVIVKKKPIIETREVSEDVTSEKVNTSEVE